MGVAVRSMMGGTEVERMGGPPQDTHGDSHKDSLLDLKLSGEHSSRFFRPSLRSRNKSRKLRFACNFERGVPYFWWNGPSYFAGRLASRENYLPGHYPHGIMQKVLFAKFAQHPVSASRGDLVFIAAGWHRCFRASAKADRPALRAF